MKRAVLITAMFLGAGAAVAAPAPVEDIAGGSGDDRLARIKTTLHLELTLLSRFTRFNRTTELSD